MVGRRELHEKLASLVTSAIVQLLLYGVFTPAGLIFRLFGRDPLRLRRGRSTGTYWITRQPPGPAPETMRNEF
jgi:hypothetical protein